MTEKIDFDQYAQDYEGILKNQLNFFDGNNPGESFNVLIFIECLNYLFNIFIAQFVLVFACLIVWLRDRQKLKISDENVPRLEYLRL